MTTTPTLAQLLAEAIAHHQEGRFAEAERCYDAILLRDPGHADANNLVGLIAREFGYLDEAIAHAETAVAAVPTSSMFQRNLGDALRSASRFDEAIAAFERALQLDPTNHAAAYHAGLIFHQRGEYAPAEACFARAAAIDPSHSSSNHLLAAVSGGERPTTAPSEYVAALFDTYAAGFDHHLTTTLGYRVPELLRAKFGAPPDEPGWTVVDLGCGTGLCGAVFRDCARRLVGCDLSLGMLAQAHERNCYDELWHEDLLNTLARFESDADVIVAADVFIYVGALEAAFEAAARSLAPGGRLAFSVETAGTEFRLRKSGRFAHSTEYVEAQAAAAGLSVESCDPATIRLDLNTPIEGRLFVLRLGE